MMAPMSSFMQDVIIILLCLGLFLVGPMIDHHWPSLARRLFPRQKFPGYLGRFRRLDGSEVHLCRLPSGRLMIVSQERPGVQARDIGTATAAEVLTWEKLATSPDGNDRVPRPQ